MWRLCNSLWVLVLQPRTCGQQLQLQLQLRRSAAQNQHPCRRQSGPGLRPAGLPAAARPRGRQPPAGMCIVTCWRGGRGDAPELALSLLHGGTQPLYVFEDVVQISGPLVTVVRRAWLTACLGFDWVQQRGRVRSGSRALLLRRPPHEGQPKQPPALRRITIRLCTGTAFDSDNTV